MNKQEIFKGMIMDFWSEKSPKVSLEEIPAELHQRANQLISLGKSLKLSVQEIQETIAAAYNEEINK